MTFGRPTMISKSWDVQAPLMIDDEYLQMDGEGIQPAGRPSRMGLFVCSSRLFEILNEILSIFYAEDAGQPPSKHTHSDARSQQMLMNVLVFNRRLDNFLTSIPQYLQHTVKHSSPVVQEKSNHIQLQEQVLYCRSGTPLNPCLVKQTLIVY
jgi:hypothetical protein